MEVTVDVVGGETRDVAVAAGATYADLVRAVGLRPATVAVVVDGRPVPEDAAVDAGEVRLLRLVQGG